MQPAVFAIGFTAAWVALLLWFLARESQPTVAGEKPRVGAGKAGVWVAKTFASLGFVATALVSGALETTYGGWILIALVCSLVGDVLLIPDQRPKLFLAGMGSFALAHIAYGIAFSVRGLSVEGAAVAAVLLTIPMTMVARWLVPHLGEEFRAPVLGYMAIIGAMGVCAASAVAAGGPALMLVGALLFMTSDLAVARDEFVSRNPANPRWGLPTYYAAQLILAVSATADATAG